MWSLVYLDLRIDSWKVLPNFYIFSKELCNFLLLKLIKINGKKNIFFLFFPLCMSVYVFTYLLFLIFLFFMTRVCFLRYFHYCTRPLKFPLFKKVLELKYIYILQYYKNPFSIYVTPNHMFFFYATEKELNEGWMNGDCAVQYGYCSACWYYILSLIGKHRHIGTYNETLKCCLENYTELYWKSVQTSLVSFCQHLNGGATLVFVWCEFTHGQVWSSLGVVTGSCKEYTHSTACFYFDFDIV